MTAIIRGVPMIGDKFIGSSTTKNANSKFLNEHIHGDNIQVLHVYPPGIIIDMNGSTGTTKDTSRSPM